MGGVREFGYLRPPNRQICVHKFDYLRAILARLCPKIWLFKGIFLPKFTKNSPPNINYNLIHEANRKCNADILLS